MENVAYKIIITPASPLSIGSGLNNNTDSDIIVSKDGRPFIPATAIAGVLKNYIAANNGENGVVIANSVFGYIPDSPEALEEAEKKNEKYIEREDRVCVYDALPSESMTKKDYYVAVRHRVKLADKVAVKGAKFDMEALEPGENIYFTSYIQLRDTDNKDYAPYLEEPLAAMKAGIIGLGADTSRGYGRVDLTVWKKEFSDIEQWLDFELDGDDWSDNITEKLRFSDGSTLLTVHLNLMGGISIREYSTAVNMPDYSMISLHKKANTPVIPGTSWAGAFKDRIKDFMPDEKIKDLFGFVDEKNNVSRRAAIVFAESELGGGNYKTVVRNSLDRFSMATKDGALYKERTYYGGETELNIRLLKTPDTQTLTALGACLMDLHRGFLAVGGLTSVGRGLFKITGIDVNSDKKTDAFSAVEEGSLSGFTQAINKTVCSKEAE